MGVAPTQVQRWRKRGMPASAEAGDIWRKNNTTRQPSPNRAGPQSAPPKPTPPPTPADPDEQAVVAMAERPEEIIEGEEACRETLKSLRHARRFCEERMRDTFSRGDEAMSRQWTQTLNALAVRQIAMEDRLRTILERDGRTMSVEAAEHTFRGVVNDLRQRLLAAPAALAAQVNPNDPTHAQAILENYVRSLFKQAYDSVPTT
jgi:hypothetical protein